MSGGIYSLTSTANDRFLRKNTQSFCQKSAEWKSPKKYFSYFIFDNWPGIRLISRHTTYKTTATSLLEISINLYSVVGVFLFTYLAFFMSVFALILSSTIICKQVYITGPPKTFFFLENTLKKNYWIFSQISYFIWKYNPSSE